MAKSELSSNYQLERENTILNPEGETAIILYSLFTERRRRVLPNAQRLMPNARRIATLQSASLCIKYA